MPFNWHDYILLANAMSQGDLESMHRSAVSRAYYAAFHHARQFREFNAPGYVPPDKAGSHEETWFYFRDHNDWRFRQINTLGSRLKAKRHDADYHEDEPIPQREAQYQCKKAQELIDAIDNL